MSFKKKSGYKELTLKEEGQEYATVLRMVGEGRLIARCADGVERLCHIRGALKKKIWIIKDDTILISLRDFQDGKADVIVKYSEQEARELRSMGEIKVVEKREEIANIPEENESGFDFDAI